MDGFIPETDAKIWAQLRMMLFVNLSNNCVLNGFKYHNIQTNKSSVQIRLFFANGDPIS